VSEENPRLDYFGVRPVSWGAGRAHYAACGHEGLCADAGQDPDNAVNVMLTNSYLPKVREKCLAAIGRVIRARPGLCFSAGDLTVAGGTLIAAAQGPVKKVAA
jgi:hypothetical protein